MSVYVDDFYLTGVSFGRMKMSHMSADTSEELLAMVDKIGLARKWVQDRGTHLEHFDVAKVTRGKAIEAGAIEKPMRDLAYAVMRRKGPNEKLVFCNHVFNKIKSHTTGLPLLKCDHCSQIRPVE